MREAGGEQQVDELGLIYSLQAKSALSEDCYTQAILDA